MSQTSEKSAVSRLAGLLASLENRVEGAHRGMHRQLDLYAGNLE